MTDNAKHPHLENAPIKEAIIDIRIEKPNGLNVNDLQLEPTGLLEIYSSRDQLKSREIGFQISVDNEDIITKANEPTILGYRYHSAENKQVAQFRVNGFSFSQLEPYQSWEHMLEEARPLWKLYAEIANATRVIRIATRFINVLNIPLPMSDLTDYFTAPPVIPDNLPQSLSSYLNRIVIDNPAIPAIGIVTQAYESSEDKIAPITLDIDVIVNQNFDANDDSYWNCLEQLRQFKNDIFFESITQKTLELFK